MAGQSYDIRMEYYENGYGGANAGLYWSSPSTPFAVIPAGQLSHATTGGWYDELQVQNTSQNNQVLGDFWVYYDPSTQGDIPVNGNGAQSYAFLLPPGAAGTGNLQFTVTTNAGNFIKEGNASGNAYSNNTSSTTVYSQLQGVFPDLTAKNLTVTPQTWQSGNTVTVGWDDVNIGDADVSGAFADAVVVQQVDAQGNVLATLVNATVPGNVTLAQNATSHQQYQFRLPDGAPGPGSSSSRWSPMPATRSPSTTAASTPLSATTRPRCKPPRCWPPTLTSRPRSRPSPRPRACNPATP